MNTTGGFNSFGALNTDRSWHHLNKMQFLKMVALDSAFGKNTACGTGYCSEYQQ